MISFATNIFRDLTGKYNSISASLVLYMVLTIEVVAVIIIMPCVISTANDTVSRKIPAIKACSPIIYETATIANITGKNTKTIITDNAFFPKEVFPGLPIPKSTLFFRLRNFSFNNTGSNALISFIEKIVLTVNRLI